MRASWAAVAALLVLAGCGLSEDEDTAAGSIEAALAAGDKVPESTTESAECVAVKWVGEIGTQPFVDDGLMTADNELVQPAFTDLLGGRRTTTLPVAEAYAAAWLDCIDFDVLALDRSDSGASAEEMDEYADCLKELDDDLWRQGLTDRWTGQTGSPAVLGLQRERDLCESRLGGA